MPSQPKDINAEVMTKIRSGELKMKPRAFFITGSIAMFLGLILSFVSATFLLNLFFFFSRAHGPMRNYRLTSLLQSLPWWVPVFAIISILTGIILLKKYDFSYQKNPILIFGGIIFALIVTAWILDYTQLNDLWFRRGPMRKYLYQSSESYVFPDRPRQRNWR